VIRSIPRPSVLATAQARDRGPDELSNGVRAFQIGVREDQRQLLAAVACRGVSVAGVAAYDAGDVPHHVVALRVAVGVVDGFDVIDVEH
jgi:hypothetical protein